MPASFSCFARSADMWPIDAQRLRLVCSATSFAPSRTFAKSRFERPWPCVTMQKRCAPAASAARACSSICSGSISACIGVSASAYFDCAQKPQSSAQPAALGVHERAHVGRLAEVVLAHHPGDVDQPLDVGVVGELAELERLVEGDQGGHSGAAKCVGRARARLRIGLASVYSYASASSTFRREARRGGRDRGQHAGEHRQDREHDQAEPKGIESRKPSSSSATVVTTPRMKPTVRPSTAPIRAVITDS